MAIASMDRRSSVLRIANTNDEVSDLEESLTEQQVQAQQSRSSKAAFVNNYDDTPRLLDHDNTMMTGDQPTPVSTRGDLDGWRLGVFCMALVATVILLSNIGLVIWSVRGGTLNQGLREVYKGSCSKVRNTVIWLHLAINAMSTLLLGGSNYCMHCLSSPTRPEIDKAHSIGAFLNIGVNSSQNLWRVSRRKNLMWWMLALSSLSLHLLYNSSFYSTSANNEYDIFLANHMIVDNGANFTTKPDGVQVDRTGSTYPEIVADLNIIRNRSGGSFHRLATPDCIREYAQPILTARRNLVLVPRNTTISSSDFHLVDSYSFHVHGPFSWLCCKDPWIESKIGAVFPSGKSGQCDASSSCQNNIAKVQAVADDWTPYGYSIDYCLSEQVDETCTLNAISSILIAVIACNGIKAVIMFTVAFRLKDEPLITIGDAIGSFLDTPDRTTVSRCWMAEADFVKQGWSTAVYVGRQQQTALENLKTPPPATITSLKPERWQTAASKARWLTTITIFTMTLVSSFILLFLGIKAVHDQHRTFRQIGLGKTDIAAVISGWAVDLINDPSRRILAAIFFANLPQLLLSFIYYNINGILTRMWLAAEWASYAKERKSLRVSRPRGEQRSTHFLHLPYHVTFSLLVASTVFHWLVSQSLYLAVVSNYSSTGKLQQLVAIASCGFSPVAIITTICLAVSIFLVLIMLGFQRLEPGIPLAGSCSAAISAACHPPTWDDKASLRKVQYGAIPGFHLEGSVGHCSFSSGQVERPVVGKLYAGLLQSTW